ncbi:unnamed protein product [Dovyalis caffra]|uniref:Outer envelope pore protein 16-4, chloroplastic n=1 Tax=Dovyalis caffra TaxID=77055 RepID=A0AAV1SA32_9ROSI|nr:unnamed protein product [Dovyalis caffra]
MDERLIILDEMEKGSRQAERKKGERNGNREKREMEEELIGVVPCSSLAVDSIFRLGTAGAIWGSCIAPYDACKKGLTGVAQASFMAKTMGKFGFQGGLVAGVFTATRCGIQRYRRQNDWVNPLIAGAVAGAAVAAGTRSWTHVVGISALLSAFSVAADHSKTF